MRLRAALLLLTVSSLWAGQKNEKYRISPSLQVNAQGEADVLILHEDDDNDENRGRRVGRLAALVARGFDYRTNVHVTRATLTKEAIEDLRNDPHIGSVTPNRTVRVTGQVSLISLRTLTGLPATTTGTYTGAGVGIAILDSGIYEGPAFRSAPNCSSSRVVYRQSFVPNESGTTDGFGHGTHVTSILSNNGKCDGPYANTSYVNGVAPDAKLINLRVLDSNGVGTDSAVINAIDRAIALKSTYSIRVMNLSLGRPIFDDFTVDPLCAAVERAWKAGIDVVVAAGNNGRDNSRGTAGYGTIGSPANSPWGITVGSSRDASARFPPRRYHRHLQFQRPHHPRSDRQARSRGPWQSVGRPHSVRHRPARALLGQQGHLRRLH